MNSQPFVVVIENPEADPSVHAAGDVEVVSVSSYPASGHNTEPEDYAEYPAQMRDLAARCRDAGNQAAAAELDGLAVEFERRWGDRADTVEKASDTSQVTTELKALVLQGCPAAEAVRISRIRMEERWEAADVSVGYRNHAGTNPGVSEAVTPNLDAAAQTRLAELAHRLGDTVRGHTAIGEFQVIFGDDVIDMMGRP